MCFLAILQNSFLRGLRVCFILTDIFVYRMKLSARFWLVGLYCNTYMKKELPFKRVSPVSKQ